MPTRLWDRAAALPVRAGERRRPQLAALPPTGLPSVDDLFTFMRDAELRFDTLRMRIDEHVWGASGELVTTHEVLVQHPGEARVTTTDRAGGLTGNYEIWLSDGETVRTYSAQHRLATRRPVRARIREVDDDSDLPGFARLYRPLTPLPAETLPELFIHPAGYCQNVLATGTCTILGTADVSGREATLLRSDHPRAVERVADRPDFAVEIAVDRETGAIIRLVELMSEAMTRDAVAAVFEPDAPLPRSAFELAVPEGTTTIF
jgi:outer membrane lipoprotein-sorting protein